ncbi:hypothetical protein MRX96_039931 [Rhipicephalus microplus]
MASSLISPVSVWSFTGAAFLINFFKCSTSASSAATLRWLCVPSYSASLATRAVCILEGLLLDFTASFLLGKYEVGTFGSLEHGWCGGVGSMMMDSPGRHRQWRTRGLFTDLPPQEGQKSIMTPPPLDENDGPKDRVWESEVSEATGHGGQRGLPMETGQSRQIRGRRRNMASQTLRAAGEMRPQ